MPDWKINETQRIPHTEEIEDIIFAVPSWIIRWGITLFWMILALFLGLSIMIRYPDIIKASLKIESPNAPKPIASKTSGKVVKLLAREGDDVVSGQTLAYIESTANHYQVLALLDSLKQLKNKFIENKGIKSDLFKEANNIHFGELQTIYQTFFQAYLSYTASTKHGFNTLKKRYLNNDVLDINKQQRELTIQKNLQLKDIYLATEEYEMHKKLAEQKVETSAELRLQESKYLNKKLTLIQTESALISSNSNLTSKQKEILALYQQTVEEKMKFLQALNTLISQIEDWKAKYVLTASQRGKLSYSGIIQENQLLTANQVVFYIDSGSDSFFGEMEISQNNMGKVKEGQDVLIKLRSYPFEEYGIIKGKIKDIAAVPYKDSIFISKVVFINNPSAINKSVRLKQGMLANAEIITQDASILQRIVKNIIHIIK